MFNFVNVAYAQTASNVLSKNPFLKELMQKISANILSPILSIIFLLAFVYFIYGIYGMIASDGDSDKRENGKKSILWGVVGMVIMLSVYGILNLIVSTLSPLGVDSPFK